MPNLVQTLENNPVFVHGGPFANIAHGCNSVVATTTALKLCDYVITEAGFGADLGAEKLFDIKCRKAGLKPSAAVLVATVRALKMHGGVAQGDLKKENVAAVTAGCSNLVRHIDNLRKFNVPVIVAVNHFTGDTEAEVAAIRRAAEERGSKAILCTHWANGGQGAEELAREITAVCEAGEADFKPLYPELCRCGTKFARSRRKSTAPAMSRPKSRCARTSTSFNKRALDIIRSASPRRSIRSQPIPVSKARPVATRCMFVKRACRQARSSSW